MRFIGCKERLLLHIGDMLSRNSVTPDATIGDLFCGTGVVSAYFKQEGYRVVANDNLFFCSVFARAALSISEEPEFPGLVEPIGIGRHRRGRLLSPAYDEVLDYLNYLPPTKGFMYRNYSPEGTKHDPTVRSYFTGSNAGKIDAIREHIEEWYMAGCITDDERALLLADLLRATAAVSNTAGTYGFFLKTLEPRAFKPLTLKRSKIVPGRRDHTIYNRDANELAADVSLDVAYLDPPYNWRQYAAYYHILETVARWDMPSLQGKSGLRPWGEQRSRYSNRRDARNALAEIVNTANAHAILLSYNADGLIAHDDIMAILADLGEPQYREVALPRYTSASGGNDNHHVQERLYYVRV
ncbi:MAG: DNA adenine methylase [Dehalococcoidia bacterium]|nr:DNA adenine methylase [Dehalococcoidia bacterium]